MAGTSSIAAKEVQSANFTPARSVALLLARSLPMPPRRPTVEIDSPIPLYRQIKDTLRAGILNGEYAPHSRMPSESELQAMFAVSRITIRQALGDLEKEGLIFKVHGKGSFVSQPRTAFQDIATLQGFAEAMSGSGHEIVNRVMSFRIARAPAEVTTKLGLPDGANVAEIHRVRLLNREPVSYEVTFLPEQLGDKLQRADLVARDIFLILENDCGIALGSADLSIDAVSASAPIARALKIKAGAPMLRIERLTHDSRGQPIDFEYLYFRSGTFQYRLRIDRKHARKAETQKPRSKR